MTGPEVVELLRWIEDQHRAARFDAERLHKLAEALEVTAGDTAEGIRRKFTVTADVAAATGRLEVWNELRQELRTALG